MQSVFEVVVFDNPTDPYEPDWEASLGIAGNLTQAVAYIREAKEDPKRALTVKSDDGTRGVIIRERELGCFEGNGAGGTVATYDWRGHRIE